MIEGILETALYTDDLDAAEAFYGGVLGLEKVLRAGNRHLFFSCGEMILLIFDPKETVKPPSSDALPVPPHGATGPGHLCFRMRAEAIDRMVEKLNKAGIVIESDFRWPNGARSIYFRDPAGNSLECAEPMLWNLK
ncbi:MULTISPECIES: VOC family protein [Rhizobiaceae]|uniref:Catechol 2,3-dioxygenase-like lactoylglutathione lyase family enzyme n=1 Tax=Aliirhizobium cellulosilyticum TaxID=393664 RepID=A0A7W6XAS0_9HYPH|nr:catechol 2,3-dioxygenase-like lactoylglutathione lyase family enzyme [Rhizobium cellulosilyticum]MBB4412887.1 catechol 2,3-dioxygenase-like lactoylglutathione lyase family enzyme [Rhizobium cellulosilyticum]MBB4447519.1 catechol 2,3-dioxygenase-like lactoylglutathione lyase family enzyme [Rhizobium cellulosilyticum]